MKSFYVRDFNDEGSIFRLDVTSEAFSYSVSPVQSAEGNVISGFVANAGGETQDFIVALEVNANGQVTVPNWGYGMLIGLGGKLYLGTDLVKSKCVDLIFLRRFQVFEKKGLTYSRWYRQHWRDWLLPSDPMMPWGGDFYQYLHYRLGKNSGDKGAE